MPNVTITVPDDLKAEMDNFPEVSWSEICRKAIARYIDERKNPAPNIELDLGDTRLDPYGYQSGQPELAFTFRIHNKMESEITVDRILFSVRFVGEGNQYTIGSGHDLFKRLVAANSIGGAQGYLGMPKETIESLAMKFKSSFYCIISCVVFAEGFKNAFNQEVRTRIPIDDWRNLVDMTLKQVRP